MRKHKEYHNYTAGTFEGYVFTVRPWINDPGHVNIVTTPEGEQYSFTAAHSDYARDQVAPVTRERDADTATHIIRIIERGDARLSTLNRVETGHEDPLHCHSVVGTNGRIIPMVRL